MQCRVDGCDQLARYKEAALCAKHYHRVRRAGTTDIVRKTAQPRIEEKRGYQFLHAPKHPLCRPNQIYVAEHRIVLFEAIGPGPMCCSLCGKKLTWQSCDVDHIDENPRNNERDNLRPTCRQCNISRNRPPAYVSRKNALAITFEGVTKTPHEWSKDARVALSGTQIRRRKMSGMSDEDSLFAKKKTHNGKTCHRDLKLKELRK